MTPTELEKIGKRIYGPIHWRSQLALNLGIDVVTVHRWGKRDKPLSYIAEVAVRGLLEKYRADVKIQKLVNEQLRKVGKRRPKLKRRKRHAKGSISVPIANSDSGAGLPDDHAADAAPSASPHPDV